MSDQTPAELKAKALSEALEQCYKTSHYASKAAQLKVQERRRNANLLIERHAGNATQKVLEILLDITTCSDIPCNRHKTHQMDTIIKATLDHITTQGATT